jgi:hypothetical protein
MLSVYIAFPYWCDDGIAAVLSDEPSTRVHQVEDPFGLLLRCLLPHPSIARVCYYCTRSLAAEKATAWDEF